MTPFKKILAHEALALVCALLFGALVLPTLVMVVLSFFGLIPRNESLAEGYAALRGHLQGRMWVMYLAVFGPYLAVQGARLVKWRRCGGPWHAERKPEGSHRRAVGRGEFALMTWRDGLVDSATAPAKPVDASLRVSPGNRPDSSPRINSKDRPPSAAESAASGRGGS